MQSRKHLKVSNRTVKGVLMSVVCLEVKLKTCLSKPLTHTSYNSNLIKETKRQQRI